METIDLLLISTIIIGIFSMCAVYYFDKALEEDDYV